MKVSKVLVSLSMFVGSVSFANPATTTEKPNCEVSGEKMHADDKAACEAKEGTWLMKEEATGAVNHSKSQASSHTTGATNSKTMKKATTQKAPASHQ